MHHCNKKSDTEQGDQSAFTELRPLQLSARCCVRAEPRLDVALSDLWLVVFAVATYSRICELTCMTGAQPRLPPPVYIESV